MLDQFEIPAIKIQMFMAAESEVRALHSEQTDTIETRANQRVSVWDHLADALASLKESLSRRKESAYQKQVSASPEC
jgi:hypothetical protein